MWTDMLSGNLKVLTSLLIQELLSVYMPPKAEVWKPAIILMSIIKLIMVILS